MGRPNEQEGRTLLDKLCKGIAETQCEGPYSTYRLKKSMVLTKRIE